LKLLQEKEIGFSANKTNANFIQTRIFNISGKNINKSNLFAMSNLMTQAIVEKRITIHSPNQILLPSLERLKLLGWEQSVSLAKGIQSTLGWIKDQNQA
jgi:hypothetical protein